MAIAMLFGLGLGIIAGVASVRLEGTNLFTGTTTVLSGTLVVANPWRCPAPPPAAAEWRCT